MNPAWLDAVVLLVSGPSFCSGAVVDDRGTVATAYHCVAAGGRPTVFSRDGTEARARIVSVDVDDDLAILEVEALAGRPHLELRGGELTVGERVYGLGSPYATAARGRLEGTLRFSASEGIVAAVGERVVQTDAALNPGNSGGPLVDAEGRIVGVVSLKLAADNLAFATRVDLLAALLEARPKRSLLGGTWSAGVGLVPVAGPYALVGEVEAVARDRIWARAQAGGVLGEEPLALSRVGLGVRQRLGNGELSTALDLGAFLATRQQETAGELPVEPWGMGRVTFGGVGVGVDVRPGDWAWGVELTARIGALHGAW